jgi:uncharacterized SAM-binding protein YcdF (DUF218 family)
MDDKINMLEFYYILIIIIFILAFISLLVSTVIIAIFILKSKSRTFIFELIFYLAISESIGSITKMLSFYKIFYFIEGENFYQNLETSLVDEKSKICILQRFLGIYSDFSSFLVVLVISYSLYSMIIKFNKDITKYLPWYRVLIFVFPLIPTLS